MSEQRLREALERVTDALTKALTGGSVKAHEAARALQMAAEAIAAPDGEQAGLTDAEIRQIEEANHEKVVRPDQFGQPMCISKFCRLKFAHAVIAAHETKRNGAAK